MLALGLQFTETPFSSREQKVGTFFPNVPGRLRSVSKLTNF